MKLITMTTHPYCTVQEYTTAFIEAQLSISQEFKTGLLMSVSLRVHGENINKKGTTGRWNINFITMGISIGNITRRWPKIYQPRAAGPRLINR